MPLSLEHPRSARNTEAVADNPDGEMQQQLTFLGFLTTEERQCLPDWMVIAPPKTGTSWLTENLRLHPQIYIPRIKELKYFSNRFETEDLRCYLAHFREGIGKKKGEAPPSYSLLPRCTIRLMRQLIPNLKVIYLMRDPIDRAWSHARHNFRYREANFKGYTGTINDVTDDQWFANFDDDWNRLAGDYLGQLQRWLSVFPREQIHLDFYENLVDAPRQTLHSLLEFLEVDTDFANSDSVTLERVNAGLSKELSPGLERRLGAIYAERTVELVEYLRHNLDLVVPAQWHRTLKQTVTDEKPAEPGVWQVDDRSLFGLLGRDDLLELDFLGFNIVCRDNQYMAYRMSMGDLDHKNYSMEWWKEQSAAGNSLFASDPYDLKSLVIKRLIAESCPPGSAAARLRQLELELACTSRQQEDIRSLVQETREQLIEQHGRALMESNALLRSNGEFAEKLNVLQSNYGMAAEQVGALQTTYRDLAGELERYAVRMQQAHEDLAKVGQWIRERENRWWRRAARSLLARRQIFRTRWK